MLLHFIKMSQASQTLFLGPTTQLDEAVVVEFIIWLRV